MQEQLSRKKFIAKCTGYAGAFIGGALLLNSCKSDESKPDDASVKSGEQPKSMVQPENCNDLSSLSAEEVDKRTKLGYVDHSPSPDMRCEICKLYLPPAEGAKCGGCSLFQGPVDIGASCTYFAPLDA
ncbi:MAG: hypothetical protein BGN92_13185 [Sphingobacteriales bacterium 41-5]|nr:MAG: hypothetical protein BGN92_13185 [Sphingobacteriales bacterium 41-5]